MKAWKKGVVIKFQKLFDTFSSMGFIVTLLNVRINSISEVILRCT